MRLCDALLGQVYIISSIDEVDEIFNSRVNQLGVFPGAEIELKNLAPFFKDPMLFNVGDSQIAITKKEAEHIHVEVRS